MHRTDTRVAEPYEGAGVPPAQSETSPDMPSKVVLIVEDEFLIGVSLKDWLEVAGYRTIGPITTTTEAIALIDAPGCDVAIVDLKLADGPADPVARKLAQRGIPFVAFTGYPPEELGPDYARTVVVPKPCDADQILDAIAALLAQGRQPSAP
jgi:DNA-binding response OmpR family regulator